MRQSFKPLSALAVIFTALAVIFACWSRGMFIPRWVIWQEKQVQLDTCFLDLKDRRLSLTDDSAVLWKTPPEWFVSDVQVSDFDLGKTRSVVCSLAQGKLRSFTSVLGGAGPFLVLPASLYL